ALKRWIKSVGDPVMMLIVMTDEQPVAALRRLFSRTGFILMPISVLWNKYYPNLGHDYDQWTGGMSFTGVARDKNTLCLISFVLSLGALWQVIALIQSDRFPLKRRQLLAQLVLLGFGLVLLREANSITSSVAFAAGAAFLLGTSLRFVRRRPGAVHALVLLL